MDKVRIRMINMHAHDVATWLTLYLHANAPELIRLAAAKPMVDAQRKLVAVCCERLRVRVCKHLAYVKNDYAMTVPAEEALALTVAWLVAAKATNGQQYPGVQHVVGELHQALA